MKTLVVVSDIHYAGATERTRHGFEYNSIPNPFQRLLARAYRSFIWQRDPLGHNGQFDKFLAAAGKPDLVVGNGDYTADTAFVGLADDGAYESAAWCVQQLRQRFGERFHSTMGDHELGKMNLFGGAGGLRLASYRRATEQLGLKRFWKLEVGNYVFLGITSSLVALPVYSPEILADERPYLDSLRAAHVEEIRQAFSELQPGQKVLLFTHDPTSLPFLAQEGPVRTRLKQIERTIIGHLHSESILRTGRRLTGMPRINFLGNTVRRYSAALQRARDWEPFNLLLCPAPTGIQLLKDGGFLHIQLDETGQQPMRVQVQPLPWD